MKSIFKTRLMLWRKSWVSLIFWLLLPILLTVGIIHIGNLVQQDAKVPVGIVIEEETALVRNLLNELKNSPLLHIIETSEREAKRMVESHELDSAFIIRKGYEDKIRSGNRNRLLIGYKSDISFAYTVTREAILSLIQKDSGRAKIVQTVHFLSSNSGENISWSDEEIIRRAVEIEADQNLLQSKFKFYGDQPRESTEPNLLFGDPWAIWSIFSLLSMLLIFDWVLKEKRSSVLPRLQFSRFSIKPYFLLNSILYLCLFLVIDLFTLFLFYQLYSIDVSIELMLSLISYRLTGITLAFTLTLCFQKLTVYYSISFIITLFVAITSGVLFPIDGITNRFAWTEALNPILPFLSGEIWNLWLVVFSCFIGFWLVKGEKRNA